MQVALGGCVEQVTLDVWAAHRVLGRALIVRTRGPALRISIMSKERRDHG